MNTSSPRFSIVVLARNEAENLPRLLRDLDDFAGRGGDVLVVDTGSTDGTVATARAEGCRVEEVVDRFDGQLSAAEAAEIDRRFAAADEAPLVAAGQRLFQFAEARNHAASSARHDYVLHLDASDELQAFDIDAFDRSIASQSFASFEYEQEYGNVTLRIARFYDRRRYEWEGRVHEVLTKRAATSAVSRLHCQTKQMLVRHNKDVRKPRGYLAGLALQVLESPEKMRWWHYLGRELFYDRHYRSAIPVLERHAEAENAWVAERSQSLCFMGECFEALDSPDEATAAYLRARTCDPTRREPLVRLASAYCERGEFEAAVQYASESLAIPHTCGYPETAANYTWAPHAILYWSLFWLGRTEEARAHWQIHQLLAPADSAPQGHARLFPSEAATA